MTRRMTATLALLLGVVLAIEGQEGHEGRADLDAFRGLGRRDPILAGLLAIVLLSMAGIPPLAGFAAKLQVFAAAVDAGRTWLVLVGVLASVVAAFFYLRLVVRMYMEDPADASGGTATAALRAAVAAPALVTVLLGIVPGPLLDLLGRAAVIRW